MKKHVLLALVILGIALTAAKVAHAKLALGPDFEGTLMITTPEGKVVMLDAGNPVPGIESKSTVEVFQGKMVINLEAGDEAAVGCLGKTGTVSGPASVEVTCGENSGTVKAIKGEVIFEEFKVADGETKTLILGEQQEAPETAAGEEMGAGTDLGIPPVDSRSLETSPSE